MSRRRSRRQNRSDGVSDRMETIREQAEDYTPTTPIDVGETTGDDAAAQIAAGVEEIRDEADTGASELDDEGPGDGHPEPIDQPAYEVPDDGEGNVWLPEDSPLGKMAAGYANPTITFDEVDSEPPLDPELFERGPLAAGMRILQALLAEAQSGYVESMISELERVLDIELDPDERRFVGTVAMQTRTASDLPDIAGAYQALVRAKAQVQA